MEQHVKDAAKLITSAIRRSLVGHRGPFVVALDGGSGVGKSTLAASVAAELGAIVVQTDDFFYSQRTGAFDFAAYDYATGSGLATRVVTRPPTRVIIMDGIYSCRPELGDLIDLSVLVEAPAAIRRQRHNERGVTDEADWHRRWDDAEDHYFAHVRPPESYDLVVNLWAR